MGRKKQDEDAPRITPKKAKNAINVAKVVVPAVVPVVAPYAVRAATALREGIDQARAKRLGIAPADLRHFTGKGAALHARIAGLQRGLRELTSERGAGGEDATRFAAQSQATLDKLTGAIRAAETMPAARRKAAHRAASVELDTMEDNLLRRFGIG